MPTVKHLVHMDSKDGGQPNIGHLVHTDSIESTRSKMSLKTAYQVIDLARKLDKGAFKGTAGLHSSVHNPNSRSSIFANFETCRLSTEERVYLHAARLGESCVINDMLNGDDACDIRFNVHCVDYMGRNALFLAVDSESVDTIEILMDAVSWECIEEALLHAIGMGCRDLVRIMVDHPTYILNEKANQETGYTDPFFRKEEKYQFPPDVTPLILAAQKNDHELIQLFLSKGSTIHKPHAINCQCSDCLVKQTTDSLKRSRSRMNAYRALASPAYMALSNPDPITATFELRQEMKKLSHVEKEFQSEYLALVEQCMDFACELMDLCRGTQEVEAVLGEDVSLHRDPLARLRLAIEYGEKKFVAHPNCQQHLTNIWYGKEMGFFQTLPLVKKIGIVLLAGPLLPLICVSYIIYPKTAVARKLRCPVTKFITHTMSHFVFLFLLGLATFGLEAIFYGAKEVDLFSTESLHMDHQIFSRKVFSKIRPMRTPFTLVQYLIIFWIIGLLWIECKQIYHSGAREHFMQYYNFMDFSIIALYMASYSLRFVAQYHVINANHHFNATSRATVAIKNLDWSMVQNLLDEANSDKNQPFGYFIHASRFMWSPRDPEIVSEILFAIANVMSFARTTYVMPSHEMLGPLQISLGRMFGDIARFIVLFVLVLMAFMVGMTNLYRYYGSHISEITNEAASQSFRGLPETVHTLFFSIFGLISLDKLKIKTPSLGTSQEVIRSSFRNLSFHFRSSHQATEEYDPRDSTVLVDQVGLILFAIYLIVVTIVLVNILIAMMSHSFDDIQGDSDMEWKFARTKLWLNYIDECSTMPVPFNMIPSSKSMMYALVYLKDLFFHKEDLSKVKYNFKRRREYMYTPDPEAMRSLLQKSSTYSEIIQRLVRRYLFKLERDKKEGEGERIMVAAEDFGADDVNDEEEEEKEATPGEDNVSNKSATNLKPITEDYMEEEFEIPIKVEKAEDVFAISPRRSNSRKRASIATITAGNNNPTTPTLGIHRSRSAEALRQLTRRATIKRVGTKRGSGRIRKHQSASDQQLEAIQRGQRLLDARLQELQAAHMTKIEDGFIRENIVHMRHLISEHQKAMGCMVRAMDSMQEELRHVVGFVTSGKGRRATTGSILTRGRDSSKSMKMLLRKKRSDPTNM